jgi:hypothetical protein
MSLIDDSAYWHTRANEARIAADCMVDVACRHILLGIAADYGRLADRITARGAWQTRATPESAAFDSPVPTSACPRMIAGKIPDVCGVHFPQMVALTP